MKAAIYTRVSTAEQKKGSSPELQEKECRNYAENDDMEIYKVYAEDFTGTVLKRPQLDKLFAAAKRKKFEMVICMSIDRLARHPRIHEDIERKLKALDIALKILYFPADNIESPATRLVIQRVLADFAAYERDIIVERTGKGKQQALKKGVRFGPVPMFFHIVDGKIEPTEEAFKIASGVAHPYVLASKYNVNERTIKRTIKRVAAWKARDKDWLVGRGRKT